MRNLLNSILYSVGLYPKKCKDCRHWSDVLAHNFDGYGVCRLAGYTDTHTMRAPGGHLETQPDFCCRLWRLR